MNRRPEKLVYYTTPRQNGRDEPREMYEEVVLETQAWCRITPIPLSQMYLDKRPPADTVLERWEDAWGKF